MTLNVEDDENQLSPTKNNVQSTVKWADIEKGIPPEQHEIESCEESDEVLPLSLAQTKLDLLLEPSNLELLPNNLLAVDVENKTEFKETVPEIDTLEAHSELIKMREKLRVEKETEKDQPNPFLPEGILAKEAEYLVEKMKDNPNCDNSNADYEYMSIESPEQSEDFNSTELNFGADDFSPNKKSTSETNIKKDIIVENTKSVAIVNHGMIVSAKTNTVERVIIPEKESRCCIIL